MSRSRSKRPFGAWCGGNSQKEWKRHANRRLRRIVRMRVADPDAVLPIMDEVANPYDSPQDGTRRYRPFSRSRLDYRSWYRWVLAK